MHKSRKVFLLDTPPRVVKVSYQPVEEYSSKANFKGSWEEYKTMDDTLEVGDYVVVPTKSRHNLTVVQVEEVDCYTDYQSSKEINWIVGKVDCAAYNVGLAAEEAWLANIQEQQLKRERAKLKEDMLGADFNTSIPLLEIQAANTAASPAEGTIES